MNLRVTGKSSSQLCLRTGWNLWFQSSCRQTNNIEVVEDLKVVYFRSISALSHSQRCRIPTVTLYRKQSYRHNAKYRRSRRSIRRTQSCSTGAYRCTHRPILNQAVALTLRAINRVDVGKYWARRGFMVEGNRNARNSANYEVGHQSVDELNYNTFHVRGTTLFNVLLASRPPFRWERMLRINRRR